jgi:diacylglycerol kinase (ATP)
VARSVARSVALLVNPTAGKGRAGRLATAATAALRAAGLSVAVLVGRDPDEAAELARAAVGGGVDALVALGGDGMVHLALQVVAGTPTPLGILPAGTGNDLAATLGIPARVPAAVRLLTATLAADPAGRPIDAVRVGPRWYGCVLGAGFDSLVNDRANRMAWPRGRMRYNLAILAELRVFRPLPFVVDLDGERLTTDAMLVAVGNGRSYGAGMRITPAALVDDGLLDVAVLGRISTFGFLRTFPKVYRGTHVRHPAVTMRRARTVTIDSPGVNAYADGEYLAPLPVTCECVPGAVRVLAP